MRKLKYRFKRCWRIALRDTFSPLFEKDKIFNFLTIPIFLILSFHTGDLKKDIFDLGKTGTAIILTFPLWFILNLILSPFRFYREEKKLGSWENNRFNYNEPSLVCTYHIAPEENGKHEIIKIKDAEPNSFCRFKIICEGGISEATITLHEENSCLWGIFDRKNHSCGIRISKNKKTKLIFKCPKNSDQTTVRVYLLSWDI